MQRSWEVGSFCYGLTLSPRIKAIRCCNNCVFVILYIVIPIWRSYIVLRSLQNITPYYVTLHVLAEFYVILHDPATCFYINFIADLHGLSELDPPLQENVCYFLKTTCFFNAIIGGLMKKKEILTRLTKFQLYSRVNLSVSHFSKWRRFSGSSR